MRKNKCHEGTQQIYSKDTKANSQFMSTNKPKLVRKKIQFGISQLLHNREARSTESAFLS